jgi:PQQ-dependent catabolism-associated CXXCW motif protein
MRAALATVVKAAIILAIPLVLGVGVTGGWAGDVPEPQDLWTGPMYGQTPRTLSGAVVADLPDLEALMAGKLLLLDVGPAHRKPENLPTDRPWLPIHRSIPGAIWMPGAGAAPLEAGREEVFYRRVGELTRGDKARPVVVFCRPECWGSWNAAKRLVMQGYTRVHWFPAGINGWQDKHETAEVKPDAGWNTDSAH